MQSERLDRLVVGSFEVRNLCPPLMAVEGFAQRNFYMLAASDLD